MAIYDGAIALGVSLHREMTELISIRRVILQTAEPVM